MTKKTEIITSWKNYAESQPDGAKDFLKQTRNNFFAIFNKAKNDMIAGNYKNDANVETPEDMCNIMKDSTDDQLLNLLVELSLKKVDPKSLLSPSADIKYVRKNVVGKGVGGPAYEYVAMAVHVTGDHNVDGEAAQGESGPLQVKAVEMGVHVDYDGKNQEHRHISRFWPFNIVSWLQLPNAHDFPMPTPYIAKALHCAAKLAFGRKSERVFVDANHFDTMSALLTKTECFRNAINKGYCWSITPKWENYCRETELDLAHSYRILENPVESDSGIRIEGPPQDDPEQWQ